MPAVAAAVPCAGSGTSDCPYSGAPAVVQHVGPGSVRLPSDVDVDADGNTWVVDSFGNGVRKFDPSGSPVSLTASVGNPDRSAGSGQHELTAPQGLGVDAAGNVYVADTGNDRVMEYTTDGTSVRQFGDGAQGAPGHASAPVDVAVDASGNVFVAVRPLVHNNEILEFDSAGTFLRRFGTFDTIAGIDVAGSHVYATEQGTFPGQVKIFNAADGSAAGQFNTSGSSPHRLTVNPGETEIAVAAGNEVDLYDPAGTEQGIVSSIGGPGSRDGQFSDAFGLVGVAGVAFDGPNLAVTDENNARVQKFTTAGSFVAKLAGPSDGELWRPGGAALGVDGKIVVADTGFNRLQTFAADGTFAAKIGRNGADGSNGSPGASSAEFWLPDDVAVDPNPGPDNTSPPVPGDSDPGNLYVADSRNGQIIRLTSDGTYLGTIDPSHLTPSDPLFDPKGVAVDASKVYIADAGKGRILVLDKATGNFSANYGKGAGDVPFQQPTGVDVTSDGDIWVADSVHNEVQVRDHATGTWTAYTGASTDPLGFPTDVAIDENDGVAWVTDLVNSRLVALSLVSGAPVATFGAQGRAPGQFLFPEHVSYDKDSNQLLVADSGNDRVQVFSLAAGGGGSSPPAVTLTAPADGAYTAPSPDFAGTAGDGGSDSARVHIEVHARNPASGASDPADLGFDVTPSGTTFAHQLDKNLPDGFYVARAVQNRGLANQGVSNSVTFNVDTTAPSPTVTAPADGGNSESLQPTISGSAGAAPGDAGQVTVEVRQGGQLKSRFTATRSGSSWSGQVPVQLDRGGTFTVMVSQDDAAHHTGTSPPSTFTTYARAVNTRAPTLAGAGTVGSTMRGDIGAWDYGGQIHYLVIWGRCPDLTPEHCVQVGGGVYPDGLSYTVADDDVGQRLLFEVAAVNPAGQFVAYSSFSGVVSDPNAPAGSNGVAAGSPKVTPPALSHTPAQSSATCQHDLYFGPVGVHADCFKRVGLTWEAGGSVEVNGLHLEPKGGAKVVIDPMNLRIATHGTVSIVAGPATVDDAKIGPFTLYEGSFDWVLQPDVKLPDATGLATAIPGFGGVGKLPSLGNLSDLPGLGSLASLPRMSDGLPDFSKLSVGDLKDLRIPTLDDVRMQIPAFYLPVTALPAIGVDTGSGASLFSLPVQGKLAMRLVNDGALFDVGLGLPQLGNLSAAAAFKVFNDGRFQLDDVRAHADEVNLGVVDLRPIDIHFNGAQNAWEGNAGAFLPFPGSPGLDASAAVKDGKLRRVGVGFSGSMAVGPSGVFLSHLDFQLDNGPPVQFNSNVSLTAGPKLGSLPPAFQLDGKFIYQAGDPAAYAFTGDAKLVGHQLASAGLEYHTNGYFHAFGKIGFHVGPNDAFGVDGSVDGWATKSAFEVDGQLGVTAPGGFSIRGKGLVSSLGIAACGEWNGLSAGAGYEWSGRISFFNNCGFSGFHPSKATARAAQAGVRTVQVPAGAKGAAFAIVGSGAAPKVVLGGPGGLSLTTPPNADSVQNDRFMLVQNPDAKTTYLLVAHPPAGAWTITPQPGSAPITDVQQADPLPAPNVRASVTGKGAKRRLAWKLTAIKGQKVTFVERSGSVARVLGRTTAAAGSMKFAPADGPGGTRRIEAMVEQDGFVREVDKVARFVAPKPRRLAAPRRARLTLSGSRLTVQWSTVPGATRYRVYATVNGGRKVLIAPKGRAATASMTGVFADTSVKVAVAAVDARGRDGARRRATRRADTVRTVTIPGLKPARKPNHRHKA